MRFPSFVEGVAVALVAAATAGLGLAALAWLLPAGTAVPALTSALAAAYLVYLLYRAPERIGRLVVLAVWCLVTALLWLSAAPASVHILVQAGLLSLIRALYFHAGPLGALADLGLTGLALTAALGAYLHTGSIVLAVWTLFLAQALFVLIPGRERRGATDADKDRFERAYREAEAACSNRANRQP